MSTEAHKLIGISLSKIAQSRASRGGVSLHKNLLVATVLHKARYIFMEEAYQIVHGSNKPLSTSSSIQDSPFNYKVNNDDDDLEKMNSSDSVSANSECEPTLEDTISELIPTKDEKLLMNVDEWRDTEDNTSLEGGGVSDERLTDKTGDDVAVEQQPPSYSAHIELTYLNLDKCENKETVENNNHLKRRRPTNEWEVEEAVLSILPKRSKSVDAVEGSHSTFEDSATTTDADLTFLDETDFLSEPPSASVNSSVCDIEKVTSTPAVSAASPAMEIDRLSSLVSIFSFANLEMSAICDDETAKGHSHLGSAGSSDQCSTQAKDNSDVLQPMPSFLAMTV